MEPESRHKFDLHRKIFVGNIGYRTSTKELQTFLEKFGKIKKCFMPKDHYLKLPRGIAFVTFSTREEAEEVLQASDERLILGGRLLRVSNAEQSQRVGTRRYESNNGKYDVPDEKKEVKDGDCKAETVDLPNELWEKIFSLLPLRDRVRIERVCHRWRDAALRLWKRQRSLDFYHTFRRFESLTDRKLNSLLKRCGPSLRSLDVSVSPRLLTDYSMQIINKYCSGLKKLDLSGVDVTNISLRDLTVDIHTLEWVRLQRCAYLGEKGLWWLIHNNRKLQYIDIKGNIKFTGQCFHMLDSKVKTLILTECKKLADVGLEKIKERCPLIEELHITDCSSLTGHAINTITLSFSNLKILHCGGSLHNVAETTWCQLQYLKSLEELNLSQNCCITNEALIAISSGCCQLRNLDVSGCHRCLTDEGVQCLALLENLQILDISYLHQITDVCLSQIATTGKLKELKIKACSGITDLGIEDIVFNCPSLELVDMSGCLNISNKLIYRVIPLRQDQIYLLLQLNIGGTSVISEDLVDIPTSIIVDSHDYSSYYLRPDKDLLLPDPYEEEDADSKEDTPWFGKPQASVVMAAGFEENAWQEDDDDYDGHFDDITDEFLENDDCLASEIWDMS